MPDHSSPPTSALHWVGGIEDAPPVVFIHGFGADRFAWAANAPALFERYSVYALELPGHGSAGRLPDDISSLGGLARDARRILASRTDTPYALIGHSLGAAVALEIGRQASQSISHIVAIAPAGWGRGVDRTFLTRLPQLQTREDALALLTQLVARPRHISPAMADHLLSGLEKPGRRQDLQKIAGIVARLERPACPNVDITWIWGALDTINPLEADSMEPSVVSVHVIPDAGHMPQIESAAKVNRIVASALPGR